MLYIAQCSNVRCFLDRNPIRGSDMKARAIITAIAAAAGLALAPAAVSAATAHTQAPAGVQHAAKPQAASHIQAGSFRLAHARRSTTFSLCLENSPGCGAELTANGNGGQAYVSTAGATLTESDCGFQSGNLVLAWRNQNGLWVHYKSSNGYITFETDSTNGCSNNADKFIEFPNNGEVFDPWNDVNKVMGTNSDAAGSPVFAGSPNWFRWSII